MSHEEKKKNLWWTLGTAETWEMEFELGKQDEGEVGEGQTKKNEEKNSTELRERMVALGEDEEELVMW